MQCFAIPVFILFLCLVQKYICDDSENEFCVTYSDGLECGDGSHVILTRIGNHEVGGIQTVTLEEEERDIFIKTINTKPLVLEIDNFLSPSECEHIQNVAIQTGLVKSKTAAKFSGTGAFTLRDIDNDMKLSVDEVLRPI